MILTIIFAMLMEIIPTNFLENTNCSFMDLPLECRDDFECSHIDKDEETQKQIRVEAVYYDINNDGIDEFFMQKGSGQYGTEGTVFLVYTKNNKHHKYKLSGEVFGYLIEMENRGILVYSPNGWDEASYRFYSLMDSKLKAEYRIDVKYAKPIRREPNQITIEILENEEYPCK